MASVANNGSDSIVGKVLRITFEKLGVKYLEFELPDGSKCFCKGKAAPGKNFDNLTKGANVRLLGKWVVSNNPQYRSMGEQFNFSDYELSPKERSGEGLWNGTSISAARAMVKPNRDKVIGHILRFIYHKENSRIFRLRSTGGNEFDCVGYLIQGAEIFEGNKLQLTGTWEYSAKYRRDQFRYKSYEVIPPGKTEKVIIRKKSNPTKNQNSESDPLSKVTSLMKIIGSKKITYEFHSPKHNPISLHVLQQLNDRVVKATLEKKDFFFLTALLDRKVSDRDVQLFRCSNRDFKTKLLQCWKDAEKELDVIVSSISRALSDWEHQSNVFEKSNAFQLLADDVPGEHGIDQLLVCLKVMRDKYNLNATSNITDFTRRLAEEKVLKEYLIGIHGVKHKIANWSLTNVTGHWFVIDEPNIKPLIKKDLADTTPPGMEVAAENADAIFEHWFGKLDEINKEYEKFSQNQFSEIFPHFSTNACEYLPFIVTQYLWFYGKYYGTTKNT